jgi:hypothetical protein
MEVLKPESEILSPYLDPIVRIHRATDGYVCFGRKLDDDWQNLPAVKLADLSSMFPQFARDLLRDSYFTLNTFWKPNREHATYLNACWVDLDLHAPGEILTVGQRIGHAIDMVKAGSLPQFSAIVYSGRGVWFLWLLVGDNGIPPKAFPEKKLAQSAINQELARRLSADRAVSDVARLIRVPGSTNTKADPGHEIVRYHFVVDTDECGRGAVYNLEGLARYLGIELPSLRDSRRGLDRSQDSQKGLRGWQALWQQRYQDFETVRQMRQGFAEGCRNRAAYLYAVILRGRGFAEKSLIDAVTQLGRECKPPLSHAEIMGAVSQSKESRRQIHNSTFADYLGITPVEAQYLPCFADKPLLKGEVADVSHLSRTQAKQLRRNTMMEIAQSYGRLPSARKMAGLLTHRGFPVSHVQVIQDYKALGLRAPDSGLLSPALPLVEGEGVDLGGFAGGSILNARTKASV